MNNFKKESEVHKNAIEEMPKIKTHIDSEIAGDAHDDLDYYKNTLINKIEYYIGYFTDFSRCNNSIIVSGSLDYLNIVLSREKLNPQMKNDLLNLILQYVMDIKEIYELCNGNSKVFEYLNLNKLEENFDSIQDTVSKDLKILPRLDADEFDGTLFE